MAKTVLIFGDSNTRGYGVGRRHRYATVVAGTLAAATREPWTFAVRSAESDFRVIASKLHEAVARHRPDVLVWQLPTGPIAYFVQYPWWVRPIRNAYNRLFRARKELGIRRDMTRLTANDSEARRTAEAEGLYLDAVYRWRPASWPLTRHANGWLAARYGFVTKATRERYLELIARHRDRMRERTAAPLLFLGPLPHSEYMYPRFNERVVAWSGDLARLLHRPDDGGIYLDVHAALAAHLDRFILRDGAHLTREGHRALAGLVAPALLALLQSCETSRQPRYEVS